MGNGSFGSPRDARIPENAGVPAADPAAATRWSDDLRNVAAVLPLGLLLVGMKGELLEANATGLGWLGLDARAVKCPDFIEAIEPGPFRQALLATGEERRAVEFRSGPRVLHADVRPMGNGTRLVSLRDVTSVASIGQMKRNLINEILHRLRTRLTTVLSVLSMGAANRLREKEKLAELLDMGRREAERLSAFVGRLRDLFLVETGAIADEVDVQPVKLTDIVGRVVRGFRPRFESKEQLLAEDYGQPEHPVRADPELLARALVHVLRNAHVHTPKGTWVKVRIGTTPDSGLVEISDNGPGIPPADLPHVFACFGQSPGEGGGEGLGLHLARQLLQAQGATIRLDSRPGGGTTVSIHLTGPGESP